MVAFIASHADRPGVDGLRWGVEPICRDGVPSTYYEAVKRARVATETDLREEKLMLAIARVHHQNYSV